MALPLPAAVFLFRDKHDDTIICRNMGEARLAAVLSARGNPSSLWASSRAFSLEFSLDMLLLDRCLKICRLSSMLSIFVNDNLLRHAHEDRHGRRRQPPRGLAKFRQLDVER